MRLVPLTLLMLAGCVGAEPGADPWPGDPEDPSEGAQPADGAPGDEPEVTPPPQDPVTEGEPSLLAPDGPAGLPPFPDAEPLVCGAGPSSVTYGHQLLGDLECEDPLTCVEPYRAFLARPELLEMAPPVAECGALIDSWVAIAERDEFVIPPTEQFRAGRPVGEAIVQESGLGFLFAARPFAERRLHVVELSRSIEEVAGAPAYELRELVLHDPWLGQIEAEYLLPLGSEGPLPTIVVLPGHEETAEDHRLGRFGQFLPGEGFAVLLISFRAWNDAADSAISAQALCQGLSMMTLRAYEAMVAMKFVAAAPESCGGAIGLLGHSGGSITSNLLAWMDGNPARAQVSDFFSDYKAVRPDLAGGNTVDCEFHPGLAALSPWINDFAAMPRPVQQVPYGYTPTALPDGDSPMWDDLRAMEHFVPFFREHLGGSPGPAAAQGAGAPAGGPSAG